MWRFLAQWALSSFEKYVHTDFKHRLITAISIPQNAPELRSMKKLAAGEGRNNFEEHTNLCIKFSILKLSSE